MVACNPLGLFSWNYRLTGPTPDESATVEFQWLSEQGLISTPRGQYRVSKSGILSGSWILSQGGKPMADARKPNPFTRRFEIDFGDRSAVLEPESALFRPMILTMPDGGGGRIAPLHPFTRRATMDMAGVPFHMQCFAFWLAALMWKRAASSSAATTS